MLGYKLEELLTLSVQDVIAPEEIQKLPEQYDRLAAGRTPRNEWRFKRKDGSVFTGELVARQFPDGRLHGMVRDVTERKRAEAQTQAVMDLAPVAIFVARDSQCLEIVGNRMAYELVRLPMGANVSKAAFEDQVPPTFRVMKEGREIPPRERPMQRAAATGEAVYGAELDFLYPDGSGRSVIGNAVPIFGGDGRPQGSVGVYLDITERKQMEQERTQEDRRKDEFLALLGHELRNPLAAISNALHLLSGGVTTAQRAFVDELIGRQRARALVRTRDYLRVEHPGDERQLRGRVRMREAAADGAADADERFDRTGAVVADVRGRRGHVDETGMPRARIEDEGHARNRNDQLGVQPIGRLHPNRHFCAADLAASVIDRRLVDPDQRPVPRRDSVSGSGVTACHRRENEDAGEEPLHDPWGVTTA
jgi:PAS domain-containing protein